MSRIFKQFGTGYASLPVSITAQVDGTTVYSGTVPTVDGPVPGYIEPPANVHGEAFSWTGPAGNFLGAQSFSITSTNGPFQLGKTLAQYNAANLSEFGQFYTLDGVSDPLSNVMIDGVLVAHEVDIDGQWNYTVPAGSTLSATLNINLVQIPVANVANPPT